jgi:hypothetical protein
MAEIKSTLDIIMEKAKKFSVTEEEKQGFKRRELEGKIKGLVQKTLDGIFDPERFQVELLALQERNTVNQILKEEVVARLDVETNSESLLKMLEYVAGSSSSAVRKVLGGFVEKAEKQKESRRNALLDSFRMKAISGSAVLPNLNADPEWARVKEEMRRQLQEEIRNKL